jgi:hypothetical protein
MAADVKQPTLQPELPTGSAGAAGVTPGSSARLEHMARALRLSVDLACAALLLFWWSEVPGSSLFMLWLASYGAIPPARIVDRLRQHTLSSAVLLLLGVWLTLSGVFQNGSVSALGGTLHPLQRLFEGSLFTLTAVSNLVASKAYPQQKTTLGSLACGAAAVAAGFVWIWLGMQPPAP